MPLKYTGRARTFNFEGKIYAHPDIYDPKFHHASYDSPITGLTPERALRYTDSNLHSFEDTRTGNDLLDQTTLPDVPDNDISTVKPEALKK